MEKSGAKFAIFMLFTLMIEFSSSVDFSVDDRSVPVEQLWKSHKERHGKRYRAASEEKKRFENFKKHHDFIQKHNANKNASFKLDHNKFSDWHEDEFKNLHGINIDIPEDRSVYLPVYVADDREEIPASFDLRKDPRFAKCIGPIKEQLCGCCWSFSTTCAMEWGYCTLNNGNYTLLSEQQLIDCDTEHNRGCEGGSLYWALHYLQNKIGQETMDSYGPHTGLDGSCTHKPSLAVVNVAQFGEVHTPRDMQSAIMKYGPILAQFAVVPSFEISGWAHFYDQGVYSDTNCKTDENGNIINHGVNLIGWGTDSKTGKDYWIMRNQWSADWGLDGYAWIERGVNMCNIELSNYYALTSLGVNKPTTTTTTTTAPPNEYYYYFE